MLVCKWCKVSDWSSITTLCYLWPQASVGNVIVNGEDLCEVTLCNMLNFIYFNMDLNLCSGNIPNTQYATMWLLQGFPEDQVHQMCSDLVYLIHFSLYTYRSVQNGVFFLFLCNFSYFCVISVISITLDQLTHNWGQFVHFGSVEA